MRQSKLFCALPEYVSTAGSMAIDRYGNLVLSCPNFADEKSSGCVVKISKDGKVTKWFDVPVHEETGVARNMGIAFDDNWNVYLCDNQGWSRNQELPFRGRVLKITVDDNGVIEKTVVIAKSLEHPNGIRIKDGCIYVTNSFMSPVKRNDEKLTSGVYRFRIDEENIYVKNDLSDRNLLSSFITQNPDCQYGVNGIVFDGKGNLYIGNFGDGEVWRLTFNPAGSLKNQALFAKDPSQLQSTGGMIFDAEGKLYIADFSANAISMIDLDGKVTRVAQSPDCTGLEGGLDQPGEPIFWNNRIIVSCFDLVTGPDKVDAAHEMPATLAEIPLI
jgi:sugar lactone lactonase YvrE